MKLAHFSDIHVTHFPLVGAWAFKRLAAVASYTLIGRGRHFTGADTRIAALLADVDAQQVEHALCTGDVTGVAAEAEFARCAELFGPRLKEPQRFTLIPGNHDRYVASAIRAGWFERHFSALSGAFPLVKPLPGDVTIVAIDTARPTSVIDSSGLVGEAQLRKLEAILTDGSLRDRFVVLALHYGLLRANGRRDKRNHGLRDDLELTALIDRPDAFVDLVVHGHMHTGYAVRTARRHVINAGSATDLHTRCGYNVYEIDTKAWRLTCTRRAWNPVSGTYEAAADSKLNLSLSTR